MTFSPENKYLQSLIENLIISHETEVNFIPLEVELDPKLITPKDIATLLTFVQEERKRLFIFKIPGDTVTTNNLGFTAQRTFLDRVALRIKQSSSDEPKINPLKLALHSPDQTVRAGIQIQKNFAIPKPPTATKSVGNIAVRHEVTTDAVLVPLVLPTLPVLANQLKALGIVNTQKSALKKIEQHQHAFTDGIVLGNLPRGFYIDLAKKAFCHTDTPSRLPSALAPVLPEKPTSFALPELDEAQIFLPKSLSKDVIAQLLDSKNISTQKAALLAAMPDHAKVLNEFLGSFKPTTPKYLVPLLAKMFVFGGDNYTALFAQLAKNCLNKQINLDFLEDPAAQDAFLTPRGLKNMRKFLQLTATQREWWNVLVASHVKNRQHHFDFNNIFEAYAQEFLPRVSEKNLTLPSPCPIHHNGHMLITLNRILDVLDNAANPQEQCLSLDNLDWSSSGVHYAMVEAPLQERFRQVSSCMQLTAREHTRLDAAAIHKEIDMETPALKTWIFRYMGQHWTSEIRLSDIQSQMDEILKLPNWTSIQKNQLLFILACTFAENSTLTAENWKNTLAKCINMLQSFDDKDRSAVLEALSRSFQFKPCPSLAQAERLVAQCSDMKDVIPDKLKDSFMTPLVSCLEHEGFDLINTLQERIEKTIPDQKNALLAISSYLTVLHRQRENVSAETFTLLAKLDEPNPDESTLQKLLLSTANLKNKKGDLYSRTLASLLCQINISKSPTLPNAAQIEELYNALADLPNTMPVDLATVDMQNTWVQDLILEKNLLPGCVFGNGDISKLDGLIVDALADAVKKRALVLKPKDLKLKLLEKLKEGGNLVPKELKNQLNEGLMPVLDALEELVVLLQTDNPSFDDVILKLKIFEEKKPLLLNQSYKVFILGESTGEFLLNLLLTGTKKNTDEITGMAFRGVLTTLHGVFVKEINEFLSKKENKKQIKDFDSKMALSWLATFNETHSLMFLFKEELVVKKVLPALRKTLAQLNTGDLEFEEKILMAAEDISADKDSHEALKDYKIKIESIASYLNLLIDLKGKEPKQFNLIYKQLSTGALTRLDYVQKKTLVNALLQTKPDALNEFLKLTTQALDENTQADSSAIDRATKGMVDLLELTDLEAETQTMFCKMSMAHNLKSASPFPLEALNQLKKSDISEEIKSLFIKQVIIILSRMKENDSPEMIQDLIKLTDSFLLENARQSSLCLALLNRISTETLAKDSDSYQKILVKLKSIDQKKRAKLAIILTELANQGKDDTVNLPALLDIAEGLVIRPANDLEQILQLFATKPYPTASNLNSILISPNSEKIQAYCSQFDANPFAKAGTARDFKTHFATDGIATSRIKDALLSLEDLLNGEKLPHSLQLKLAKQLTYIETLGYTDPLNPDDFSKPQKLTAMTRKALKDRLRTLLSQFRANEIPSDQMEAAQLELLALIREAALRTTGMFPNSTQMLVCLLSQHALRPNLIMRINTGEGKTLISAVIGICQWALGTECNSGSRAENNKDASVQKKGTVDLLTANRTLLERDYVNTCEPIFTFAGIKSACITSDCEPEDYQLNGINCSTMEDMKIFRMKADELNKQEFVENGDPIHPIFDECDDPFLDQTKFYKLVSEQSAKSDDPSQWIYPLAWEFVNLPALRNIDSSQGKVWDEEEDLEQFRSFLNKAINTRFNGDAAKQNFIMAASNTLLKKWINASLKAATYVENKNYVLQTIDATDQTGSGSGKKVLCIPLLKSTPQTGIFNEGVQQALQAKLKAENGEHAQYIVIDPDPKVIASQSGSSLIRFYQTMKGRFIGISGTPGDRLELQYLTTILGTQALGIAPHAGDKRKIHQPVFTFSAKETVTAIHGAINNIKRTVTQPNLVFKATDPMQTYEERESFIDQTTPAREEWRKTQTQPVLIVCEDFDEAKKLGASFDQYKKAGFTIQIVTGKESPIELERIIKQAGEVNTITIGTAMLARGIDINPGNHPEGLFVIQTYTESDRMTTQIAGRAARNGKPGQWLAVYQVQAIRGFFNRIWAFLFPSYRQTICQEAVTKIQTDIKLQASVDRLYTQAIDSAQQTLMQQMKAWESLLQELYPADTKLQYELYQWREALLSEIAHLQETSVAKANLEPSIKQFKTSICRLWENVRGERWEARAKEAPSFTAEQSLRLSYLKQLDLSQELNIQSALQQKSRPFEEGTMALMHHNLESTILDKAGAVLEHSKPADEEKKSLQRAQIRQLLPDMIGELCRACPQAISKLDIKDKSGFFSFLPNIFNGNKEDTINQLVQAYRNILKTADANKIQTLLEKIKPVFVTWYESLSRQSVASQFKMQGLILVFTKLYQQSGLAADPAIDDMKSSYDEKIMTKLTAHLVCTFSWSKKSPQPLHALLERSIANEAAREIYDLAEAVGKKPGNGTLIRALLTALHKHRINLQDKTLFSIGHANPRTVINMALDAFESLKIIPDCSQKHLDICHDSALSHHHLKQFRGSLERASCHVGNAKDPVWLHLKGTLLAMSCGGEESQTWIIEELWHALARYSTYAAYRPYKYQLDTLKAQLNKSMEILKNQGGLKHDNQFNLLTHKATRLATLFDVDARNVRIQKGCDGIQSYIELQVENATLKDGFTGYQSSFLANMSNEKSRIEQQKSALDKNQKILEDLLDASVCELLPQPKKTEFGKLFKLKNLLTTDWNNGLESSVAAGLPFGVQDIHNNILQLKQWDWMSQPIDLQALVKILGNNPDPSFMGLLDEQTKLHNEWKHIQSEKLSCNEEILEIQEKISEKNDKIKSNEIKMQDTSVGIFKKFTLIVGNGFKQLGNAVDKRKLDKPNTKLEKILKEEEECLEKANKVNKELCSKKDHYLSILIARAKELLNRDIHLSSKKLVRDMQQESNASGSALESLKAEELKKSRYQTRRFFTHLELFDYEAHLKREELLIPSTVVQGKEKPAGFFAETAKKEEAPSFNQVNGAQSAF